jgi:hypothetical protein
VQLLEEALQLERALGNTPEVASSLAGLGAAAQSRGEYDQARRFTRSHSPYANRWERRATSAVRSDASGTWRFYKVTGDAQRRC